MKLYIVYGSQSKLLNPFFKYLSKNDYCIRIYNNKVPNEAKNFFDIKSDNNLIQNLKKVLKNIEKEVTNIYFIGAASMMSKNILLMDDKETNEKAIISNISNYVNLTNLILRYMVRIKHGKFIYLSSFRAIKPTKGTLIYSGSKAFCEIFFKGVGLEYGSKNITTHIIRMGAFDGAMLHDLGTKYIDTINKEISLKRPGTAEELFNVIKMCLDNDYLNTGIIEINGGLDIDISNQLG